ncbi:MAG: hypothetical protein FWD56_04615 [Bacteroidales bacterium]|nr:hypothetical protein [Bacteroidales bacterium]
MKKVINRFGLLFLLTMSIVACVFQKGDELSNDDPEECVCNSYVDDSIGEDFPAYIWPEGLKYYYAFDKKRYLNEVPNKIVLSFDEKCFSTIEQYLKKSDQIVSLDFQINHYSCICIVITAKGTDTNAVIDELRKQAGIKSVYPVYVLTDSPGSAENYMTDELVVQFRAGSSSTISEMHKKYHVTVKKITEIYQLLSVPVNVDVMGVANAYQESGLVLFSHPNKLSLVVQNR